MTIFRYFSNFALALALCLGFSQAMAQGEEEPTLEPPEEEREGRGIYLGGAMGGRWNKSNIWRIATRVSCASGKACAQDNSWVEQMNLPSRQSSGSRYWTVGWAFDDHWRLEGEHGFYASAAEIDGDSNVPAGYIDERSKIENSSASSYFINVIYDHEIEGGLRPYAGAGFGRVHSRLDYNNWWQDADFAAYEQNLIESRNASGQIIAGIDVPVNDKLYVGVQGRYRRLFTDIYDDGSYDVSVPNDSADWTLNEWRGLEPAQGFLFDTTLPAADTGSMEFIVQAKWFPF